ncbi:MAG: hypothetical protein A3C07_01580 [Candidatus Sungbacteria bacterium RIFCSPHIGHO2_02_FULL_47_11]|uniref:Uncharacterized protein n=1 Tax=Candidatus Sungbacteria bacterium RIFCSPHIGHO2_02_FULL_47_11 TaxID=1802270 RepID=A0A1G2KG91_9BACT|nr:MAG: hypothetical protein A3C07_01580 [Candidatus Sungbacteria bacterium RIFCSPHIGHO2_02_FULL_47_11]
MTTKREYTATLVEHVKRAQHYLIVRRKKDGPWAVFGFLSFSAFLNPYQKSLSWRNAGFSSESREARRGIAWLFREDMNGLQPKIPSLQQKLDF